MIDTYIFTNYTCTLVGPSLGGVGILEVVAWNYPGNGIKLVHFIHFIHFLWE